MPTLMYRTCSTTLTRQRNVCDDQRERLRLTELLSKKLREASGAKADALALHFAKRGEARRWRRSTVARCACTVLNNEHDHSQCDVQLSDHYSNVFESAEHDRQQWSEEVKEDVKNFDFQIKFSHEEAHDAVQALKRNRTSAETEWSLRCFRNLTTTCCAGWR